MSFRRFLKRLHLKLSKKEKVPEMDEIELSAVEIFLNSIRKKESQMFSDTANSTKKLVVKYNDTIISLNGGLITLCISGQTNSVLLGTQIESYLIREFNRISKRKMYRIQLEIQNSTNKDLKNLLNKIKS